MLRKGGELLRRNQSDGMLGGRNPRGDQGHHAGGQSTFAAWTMLHDLRRTRETALAGVNRRRQIGWRAGGADTRFEQDQRDGE